jgi:hypothetical protein
MDPEPMPEDVKIDYTQGIWLLLAIQPATDSDGQPVPHQLRLSPDAKARWLDFARSLEPQLSPTGKLGGLTDWAAKLTGAVIRLAGVLHCADVISQPWHLPVGADTMSQAIKIARYLIPHAQAAFRLMGSDGTIEDAEYMMRHLQKRRVSEFSKRDAFEWTKGRFQHVAKMEPALQVLEEHNIIRAVVSPQRTGAGRKPSQRFEVNPQLYSQNSQNGLSGE